MVASMTFRVLERRDGTVKLDRAQLFRPDHPSLALNGSPITIESITEASVVFERSEYGVTFQAGANGRLEGNLAQTVTNGGNTTPVTAVPNDGYVFAGWAGVDTPDENPLVIENVTSDRVVTATFRAEDSGGGGGGGGCFISSASDGSAWALLAAALFSLVVYRRS